MVSIGGPQELLDNVEYAFLEDSVYQMLLNPDLSGIIKDTLYKLCLGEIYWNDEIQENIESYKAQTLNKSLFQHEENAIQIIRNSSKAYGQLLNNIYLYEEQTNSYFEYDIILIGHSRLYVIELKHWSGRIQVAPHNWLIRDAHFRADPHKNNGFKCKILKGIYQHHFRTYPNIWVESIVVLTNPEVEVEGADSPASAVKEAKHNLTFSSIGDLLTYVKKRAAADKPLLNNEQIQHIADYLQGLNQPRPSNKYAIPGYETVQYLLQRPEGIELLARPIGPVARGLNRFRVFRIPDYLTGQERERYKRRAFNTINAVSQLNEHPNILKVWLVPNNYGDIIEGSDWSETGTLRDYIHTHKGTLDINEINAICYGITQGLNAAHQNNIIHRAVCPENILLLNGVPKLMNFDLAYQMEDNHLTVITDIEALTDDGYMAPEVLQGHDIDESTDFFALGVIAYELITGSRPFQKVRQFVTTGGRLGESELLRLREKGTPSETIELIEALIQADRRHRISDVNRILTAFSADQISIDQPVAMIQNARLKVGETYDMYEIIEFIGEGREAQIYKARNGRSEIVALKLFNREIERERIFREGDYTAAVKSAYVVGCNNNIGHWKEDRYFLVMDYIEGESMRELINRQISPQVEEFRNVALCLLQGVQAFHNHVGENGEIKTILHCDIKPDNIIITKDGKAVLIDCGIAGPPRVDIFQGTLAYIPPDNLSGADMQFSADGDLFALGISLWEWFCGKRPYEQPAPGEQPFFSPDCLARMPENLRDCLLKAISTEREHRYLKVEDMIADFTGIKEEEKPKSVWALPPNEVAPFADKGVISTGDMNPFVHYLNSLSNASAGNENAMQKPKSVTYSLRTFG
ncbi:protein kinase domain-containing protein [Syntrophomonas palmitatica]|uniref:protein kinase domain-containing protein n=1 Tax=Syntrophomonas palmitatica TaxID=402877 RepID=UPI00155D9615|nr:protein kinase [Syntrophomonas palmitatica]